MENAHLIVGLGNPGRAYVRHRHNAGFMVVARLAAAWRAGWVTERKFNARLAHVRREDRQVFLCQPETYMNASGEAVGPLRDFYQVPLDRLLVVVDDADLPLGELRMRPGGGPGGHHGLESIVQRLGSVQFPRLRIGIGRAAPEARQITGYVLSDFAPAESGLVEKVLTRAGEQVQCWFFQGIGPAMNRFNGSVPLE